MTIGNLNDAVNLTNPTIKEIYFRTDLAGINTEIKFYNGIVKNVTDCATNENFYTELRPGYKAETTTDGTILVLN